MSRPMPAADRPLYSLEIVEDATTGISIRLHHNGRIPRLLNGVPRELIRRATPWFWTSYERRILQKARAMSRQSYRLVRDTLILERIKLMQAERRHPSDKPRLSWLQRRRLWQQHRATVAAKTINEEVTRSVAVRMVEAPRSAEAVLTRPATLSEQVRAASGTALAHPQQPVSRSRLR